MFLRPLYAVKGSPATFATLVFLTLHGIQSRPCPFWLPTAVLLALMAMNKPKHAGIGLAVVLLGLPVYHLVFSRLAPREAPGDASSLAESSPASAAVETT